MNSRVLIILCILISSSWLMAGETTISGLFPGAGGHEIRLMIVEDYLTHRPVETDAMQIRADGSFEFSFSPKTPVSVVLRIDHSSNSFFVEPGLDYNVVFEPFDFNASQRRNVNWLQEEFEFEVSVKNEQDYLNPNILLLHDLTDDFIYSQSERIRVNFSSALREFQQQADSVFRDVSNPFFQNYYRYHFASLYHSFGARRPMQIYDEYFKDHLPDYNNVNYMHLINRVFFSYIQGGNSSVTHYDLRESVNSQMSYHSLMDILAKDEVFDQKNFRELILLLELNKMFDNREFHRENITNVLEQVTELSSIAQHRTIARNIIWSRTRMQPGLPAPDLELHGQGGEIVTLKDFKEKYLVLSFLTTWCQSCVSDLGPLASMATEFADQLYFAAIIVDRDKEKGRSFVEGNNLPLGLFYFEHDYRLLENYRVTDVPTYIVIDPRGNIAIPSLPAPGSGASDSLKQLLGRK